MPALVGKSLRLLQSLRWSVVVFALGLAASVAAAWWQKADNDAQTQAQLQVAAQSIAAQLKQRMTLFERGVHGIRAVALAQGPERFDPAAFHRAMASRDMPRDFPGVRGMGYARRVPQGDAPGFARSMRTAGMPDFRVKTLAPHEGDSFVLQMLAPLAGNAQAIGLDMASEPLRRSAALASVQAGHAVLSAPLHLTPALNGYDFGFLLFLPVYRTPTVPPPAEREAANVGWAVAAIVAHEVLADFVERNRTLALAVTDATPPGEPARFFTSRTWRTDRPAMPVQQVTLELLGRRWMVQAQAQPAFAEGLELRSPVQVLVAGAMLSSLLALLTHAVAMAVRSRHLAFEERARQAAVVDSAHDAIVVHGLDDRVQSWNAAAQHLLGWTWQEAVGQNFIPLTVPPERRQERWQALERVQRGEDVPAWETVCVDRTGQWIDVAVSIAPIRDRYGQVCAVAATLRDIRAQQAARAEILTLNASLEQQVQQRTAELQALAETLRQRTLDAEAASRAKSAFLANMSHELRTPLHGLMGLAQTLAQAPLPRAQRQQAQLLVQSGRLLLGLIDDLLDFSRIEAGQLRLERVPLDLNVVVREVVALFEPLAQDKGLTLTLQLPQPGPRHPVLGDPLRLAQVLNNLVSNAVKFTAAGEVRLALARGDGERWRFAVSDTGIGMTPQQLARVFEPFTQADESTTRRFGGSGLGLAIVSHLVKLHDGELGAFSEPGRGSTFWVELELPPADADVTPSMLAAKSTAPSSAAPFTAPASFAGREALVAEDNELNMLLVCTMLEPLGLRVRQVPDGAQAVQAYAQGAPDIVLMDMHMPVMDGLQATQRIRALEALQGQRRVPVVALTASALAGDRQCCLQAGMDEVLAKPFEAQQLHAVLARMLAPAVDDGSAA